MKIVRKFVDTFRSDIFISILFVAIATLVIIFRCLVLKNFSFVYTDGDQAIMWNGASEFSKGFFHETRFFGQNYNSMIEGLLAVPLLFLSIPVYKALPVITSVLALFPFFIVALICFYKELKIQSLLVICIPLLLPIEYDLLTSLPRGFVTGIFISSIGWLTVFSSDRNAAFRSFAFFSVVGYSLNPNALLLSLPLLFYLFYTNIKNRSFYLNIFAGGTAGGLIHFLLNFFYVLHPNYSTRPIPGFEFSPRLFPYFFSDLNKHLSAVSPLFWNNSWFIFLALFALVFLFLKNKQPAQAFSLLAFVFFIFFSFGFNKIFDGTDSVFFSYSRMFLTIPLAFVFFIPFIKIKYNWIAIAVAVVSIVFFTAKVNSLSASIDENVDWQKEHMVMVAKTDNILKECQEINYLSKKNKTDLVIVYSHGYYDLIDFGCAACISDFPKTIFPGYERRTWRMIEDKDVVYPNIIIIDEHQELTQQLKKLSSRSIYYLNVSGYVILSNNTLKTMDLLTYIGIPIRKF